MAQTELSVPFRDGYNFGTGVDLLSGAKKNKPVNNDVINAVDHAGGATVDFTVQRIETTHDLETSLGIDAEASYGSPSFGAGVSARFSFVKKSKIQKNSLFMSITVTVKLKSLSIDAPSLTTEASKVVDRPDIFAQRFGNVFVQSIDRGGLFVGVLRVDTANSEESETINSELKGTYGLFSASAQEKFAQIEKDFRSDVFVQMYHEGGPVELGINDPTNPLELLRNANLFLSSFRTNPDDVAVPYFVTLAPVTIATGPLPPNEADLGHAQDVMRFCATRRSTLLDQLNLLQLIVDRPARYDFSNGASLKEIAIAAAATETDLDLIASCASAAINSPKGAKFPKDFANDVGQIFPSAVMPAILPEGKPRPPGETPPTILLPNMVGIAGGDIELVQRGLVGHTIEEVMAGTVFLDQDNRPMKPSMGRAQVEFFDLVEHGELSVEVAQGDITVTAQFPSAGTLVAKGSKVILQSVENQPG
jgi:hypothetical protein